MMEGQGDLELLYLMNAAYDEAEEDDMEEYFKKKEIEAGKKRKRKVWTKEWLMDRDDNPGLVLSLSNSTIETG
jgi:hypothetical protein